MAGKGRVLAISAIFLSLAVLAASFQNCALLVSLLVVQYHRSHVVLAGIGAQI